VIVSEYSLFRAFWLTHSFHWFTFLSFQINKFIIALSYKGRWLRILISACKYSLLIALAWISASASNFTCISFVEEHTMWSCFWSFVASTVHFGLCL
jgi:hypothetical protein